MTYSAGLWVSETKERFSPRHGITTFCKAHGFSISVIVSAIRIITSCADALVLALMQWDKKVTQLKGLSQFCANLVQGTVQCDTVLHPLELILWRVWTEAFPPMIGDNFSFFLKHIYIGDWCFDFRKADYWKKSAWRCTESRFPIKIGHGPFYWMI